MKKSGLYSLVHSNIIKLGDTPARPVGPLTRPVYIGTHSKSTNLYQIPQNSVSQALKVQMPFNKEIIRLFTHSLLFTLQNKYGQLFYVINVFKQYRDLI